MQRRAAIRLVSIVLVVACIAAIDNDAQAAFIYSLRFDQSVYHVSPGGTVAVSLILREEVNGGDTNRITNTNGVTAGNVKVNWNAGGSTVNAAGDASYGSELIGMSKVLTANDIILNQLSIGGATGSQVSASVREVSLGTLTFSVPLGDNTTTITFGDPHTSPFDDLVIGSGGGAVVIDPLVSYGSAELQISNPEPSTFLLTGMGILGAAAVGRFRRQRSKPE